MAYLSTSNTSKRSATTLATSIELQASEKGASSVRPDLCAHETSRLSCTFAR